MSSSNDLGLSIVIPIYNEEKNLTKLISEINLALKNYSNYEIIIVNDFSTDSSSDILESLNSKKINIFNNSRNMGQSYSLYKGIQKSKNNIIISIDGDGQNNPKDIPYLIEKYISNDAIKLVGGIRKNRKDNIVKIVSSRLANLLRSKIFDDGCSDTGCSLKVFDKSIFLKYPYFNGIHRFIPALFRGVEAESIFIFVDHRKRLYGQSNYGTFYRMIKGIIDIIKVKRIIYNIRNNL
jgi:dolichol-phosphate mannosyltransferase